MKIIFCENPLNHRTVDPDYRREFEAAQDNGFEASLVSYETLAYDSNATKATTRIAAADQPQLAIFRGWMMQPPSR